MLSSSALMVGIFNWNGYLHKKTFFFLIFSFNLSGKRQIRKLRGQNESESDSEEEVCTCLYVFCRCVCVCCLMQCTVVKMFMHLLVFFFFP